MAQNVVEIIIKAIDNTKSGLTTPITSLESLSGALGKLSTFFKIGEAAATYFFEQLISKSIESAAQLEVMSEKTGLSTESLSTLGYAAQQSDLSMEQLELGLKKMSTAMYQAEQGNYKTIATFQGLGVSIANSNGSLKTQDQVLLQVAQAFSKMQDGAAKSAIAVQLFGKSGTDMIPFLDKGAAGIAQLEQQARDFGLEIGGKTAEEALTFQNTVKQIKDAVTGFGNSLAKDALPFLVQFSGQIRDMLLPGQSLRLILDGIGATFQGAFKFGAIIIDLIVSQFQRFGNVIATLGVSLTDLFSGNFKQSVKDIGNGFEENGKITDELGKKLHDMIYDVDNGVKKFGSDSKNAFDTGLTKPAKSAAQAIAELKKSFTEAHPQMAGYFTEMDTLSKKAMGSVKDLAMGGITALGKAIDTDLATSLTDLADGAKTFSAAADELFQALLKSVISYVANLISATIAQKVMGALGEAVLGSSTAASIAAGGLVAGAWASPAALVSLASFGANAGPATAALVTTSGIAHGIAGYEMGTDYINQTGPAILHQGERVVPQKTNKDLTDALNGGGMGGGPSVVHAHISIGQNEFASAIINLQRLKKI